MKGMLGCYIQNMTATDIKNYCLKNNFRVNDQDINTMLYYIKNYWEQVYEGDTSIFNEMKGKIDKNSYDIMISLYNNYKKFI